MMKVLSDWKEKERKETESVLYNLTVTEQSLPVSPPVQNSK